MEIFWNFEIKEEGIKKLGKVWKISRNQKNVNENFIFFLIIQEKLFFSLKNWEKLSEYGKRKSIIFFDGKKLSLYFFSLLLNPSCDWLIFFSSHFSLSWTTSDLKFLFRFLVRDWIFLFPFLLLKIIFFSTIVG